MRIMITGGGTGGHTSPAVAVIEEFQRRDPRFRAQWVGRKGGIEERICERMQIPFRSVPIEGWPRKRTLRRLWVGAKLAYSVLRCMDYIRRFRPQAVIGVGGYVSLPLCYAAQRLTIPTILHEQNKRLGMANRVLAPRATHIMLSYPETLGNYPKERSRVVGNPVRAGFSQPIDKRAAREKLGLDPEVPVVLVSGGSQGAHSINQAMIEILKRFQRDEAQFVWTTGSSDAAEARKASESAAVRAEAFAFLDDMPAACAASDLIVARSGASTTAEIAMVGKPSVLVPYPFATDNHQEDNARAFEAAGASVVVLDKECTGEHLATLIRSLLGDAGKLEAMSRAAFGLAKPGAAEAIVEQVLLMAFEEDGVAG